MSQCRRPPLWLQLKTQSNAADMTVLQTSDGSDMRAPYCVQDQPSCIVHRRRYVDVTHRDFGWIKLEAKSSTIHFLDDEAYCIV
jgi:hypothetical protein